MKQQTTKQDPDQPSPISIVVENIIYGFGIAIGLGVAAYAVYASYIYFDNARTTVTGDDTSAMVATGYLILQYPFLISSLIAAASSLYAIFAVKRRAMLVAAIALALCCVTFSSAFDDFFVPALVAFLSYLCMSIK